MNGYERLLEEHRELVAQADALRIVAKAPAGLMSEPRTRAVLRFELARLRDVLERHFELEERGGYLEEVTRLRPGLDPQVHALLLQHAAIRDDVAAAIEAAELGAPVSAVAARALAVVDALSHHEAAETELFQEAVLRDVQAAD